MSLYYPAFISLKGKKCVVVGGGRVAERKVSQLVSAGGVIKVISPVITEGLRKHKAKRKIIHIERRYQKGDLRGAFLVIAASSDKEVNNSVSADAEYLVNVIDQPELANFIAPAVISREPLAIAVSTSGASPAFSKTIREELEQLYPSDIGRFLRFMKKMREKALKELLNKCDREKFLKTTASKQTLEKLRSKGFTIVKNEIEKSFDALRRNKVG
ncbi:MAG: bifunctional precorrin-2 dehydrogenase/sirohydrochlorin ferrochelatase [Nitrospirae bacterium]|nr:bifunctional precorrin-2 dehydrogenase/sirohydrochlorin ferrochelatase [Nitrospirota bacterium]